jgi:hypothetical protein
MATKIDAGRRVFANLKYLYFTPWKSESEVGTTTYDLVNIVGDTTNLEQAENEINALEHEFSNEPLYENITLGEKTFTTECIDFQDTVLKELFGWKEVDGNYYAPTTYKDLFCQVEMGFNSTNDVIVLPKVKLNSRAVIASMKTDASRGNITGTCYSAYINGEETDMAVIKAGEGGVVPTYTVAAEAAGE